MRNLTIACFGLSLWLSSLAFSQTPATPRDHSLNLPIRAAKALSGSAFMKKIERYDPAQREIAIVKEILRGNVPSFMRQLVPIESRLTSGPYKGETLRYWILPDYLAIGSDSDYVRVPLNLYSIDKLESHLDLSLPTRKMVNEIYAHATIKLVPNPVPYSRAVASTGNILRHNNMVQSQIQLQAQAQPGILIAGHKKDVVQSRRLLTRPQSIAIYGWHRDSLRPIQPLSTIHSADYSDYSHGIRLVDNTMEIGSRTVDLRDVLSQRWMSALVSDEGPIPQRTSVAANPQSRRLLASHP